MADTLPNLSQQVGPLPLWGWAAAAAGGISLGVLIRRRAGGAAPKATTASTGAGGEYIPVVAGTASTGTGGVGTVALGGGGNTTVAQSPTGYEDNTSWQRAALAALVSNGYGPLEAQMALSSYLDGRQPTADQRMAIDFALGTLGLPPSPPTIIPPEAPAAPDVTPLPETKLYGGDPLTGIVTEAYRSELGRDPDPEGLTYWRSELASGRINQDQLRYYLDQSTEGHTLTN